MTHPYRIHPQIRLCRIPTLMRWTKVRLTMPSFRAQITVCLAWTDLHVGGGGLQERKFGRTIFEVSSVRVNVPNIFIKFTDKSTMECRMDVPNPKF